MRLVNCQTLQLEEFNDIGIPPYAILSHTWGSQETSFSDYTANRAATESKDGYKKIRFACQQASKEGIPYLWADTCCIDKSSSAELTENVNSMYRWYYNSDVCYVYLTDVSLANCEMEFPQSQWFSRGWTLQELLAPSLAKFYDKDWCVIGTRSEYAQMISEITRIDINILRLENDMHKAGFSRLLSSFCVAKRMSWASSRETTRVEDIAYCLLGIFNVNMPLLYGEGEKAFLRLQEEIIQSCNDDSILAWGLDTEIKHREGLIPKKIEESICGSARMCGLLARSPKDFENCQDLENSGHSKIPFMMTNLGLQIELPLVPVYTPKSHYNYYEPNQIHGWLGLLGCSAGMGTKVPGIILWAGGVNNETPDRHRLQRASFNDYFERKNTFLLGVRAATQATFTKITILRYKKTPIVRDKASHFRHIVINETQELRHIGYRTRTASAQLMGRMRWPEACFPTWCPDQRLFTIQDDYAVEYLVRVHFELRRSEINHQFSVFIRARNATKNVIVRQGSAFTELELRQIYDFLKENSQQDDGDDPVISIAHRGEYIRYRIVVSIEKKVLFRWSMYEVSVDAVRWPAESERSLSYSKLFFPEPRTQNWGMVS
jgi:hypothetical protein